VADLIDRVNPYNMRLDLVTKNFDRNSTGKAFWFFDNFQELVSFIELYLDRKWKASHNAPGF